MINRIMILVLIAMLAIGTTSDCTTQNVFPLLYGDGDKDVKIMDAAEIGTDLILVGQSKIGNSQGEGYLMRIDKYGKITYQKLYRDSSSDNDRLDKVVVHSATNTTFVVGTSSFGGASKFFGLKLDNIGNVLFNTKIGDSYGYVSDHSTVVYFRVIDSSSTFALFQVEMPNYYKAGSSVNRYVTGAEATLTKFDASFSNLIFIDYKTSGAKTYAIMLYSSYF